MKNIIIGTAGHVDHGKTTLIRALTGIETDRLREEQERGMSIELGFAHFNLPGGACAGIVDVPGHQRFIKNMLAGATGMDMVILVVAADEGVMPQTREHFDILRFLNVQAGVIALTKADSVDEEWLELVTDDVRSLVNGSFLEGAPVIPVSAVTGQGMDNLITALDEIATRTSDRVAVGPFRMPIDRVFSMPGFGAVVTGTLHSGVVRVGEAAEILPQQKVARVRGIQVHGQRTELARAGTRVAINLAGVELSDAGRGDVVAAAGAMQPTSMVDVRLQLLDSLEKPLSHRSRIRFHTGAVEIMGRIALLDREVAKAGESVLAQVRLESPTAVGRGERFVLRRYSPGGLLGGGVILDPHPGRHRRNAPGVIQTLQVRERGTPEELVIQALLQAGPAAVAPADLAARSGLSQPEVLQALNNSAGESTVSIGPRWVHGGHLQELERHVLDILADYHAAHPLLVGIPKEDLRARCGRTVDVRVFNFCIEQLTANEGIASDAHLVRLPGHTVKLEGVDARAAESLLETYSSAGLNPPTLEEALTRAGGSSRVRLVFDVLVHRGDLVRLAEGLYLHRNTVEAAVQTAVDLLHSQPSFTVSQLRDALGSSRKIVVPLSEYLDATHVTRRRGDERVLY